MTGLSANAFLNYIFDFFFVGDTRHQTGPSSRVLPGLTGMAEWSMQLQ